MVTDILLKAFRKDPTIKRHLLKTISWRIIGSLDTVLLGWLISGQLHIGAKIGAVELFTKMILYFLHERLWYRTKFGVPSRSSKAARVRQENAQNLFQHTNSITRHQRENLNNTRSFTIWLTGLSAAGKSSIASELDKWLFTNGYRSYVLDGDNTRLGINSDLSFAKEDRSENIRRVAEICKLFNDAGVIVIASFISPFSKDRLIAKNIIGPASFIETFVDADIATCKSRDIKGLYKLAEEGKIKDFTGIDSPYEAPSAPDIHIHSGRDPLHTCVNTIINHLKAQSIITTHLPILKEV